LLVVEELFPLVQPLGVVEQGLPSVEERLDKAVDAQQFN
jgi:hypothetical protein